ncbi:hypothetical protein EF888_08155 [Silicimonas algicola]|uniref:Uncharacterized protein n=1 Tax=Silicimonas algicola TaxID=1826607 RepID=A0A316G344_9RHOB|nr:hypothetical protein [Silicimonas algicola]AZQ67109.1 hypothetical protein EF888_08155 [Silicimonas algicola]PWK55361.1 hypothetical protein C8D95_10726 [Silicimonas algicola]
MFATHAKPRAVSLPALEAPQLRRTDRSDAMRQLSGCVEITGYGEGGLSLARLNRSKYLAIVTIFLLATVLQTLP